MNINELGKRIVLEGTINTRSLGGYETKEGKRIKEGRIYRSDALCHITPNDQAYLRDVMNLRVDIDLRGKDEIKRSPDLPIEGCHYLHCPVEDNLNKTLPKLYPHPDYDIPDSAVKGTVEYLFRLDPKGDATYAFERIYRNFVSLPFAQEHYSLLLRTLLNNKEGAALFHCADGKDRCGTGVALFLSLLGVDREVIIEDYLKTNANTKAKADKRERYLREVCHMKDETVINSVRIVAGVRENFLRAAFDEIDTNFGGIDSYIHNQLGFTDEMIQEMKDNYLEDVL